jgi:hypothetical protein|tara:strand:- start:27265 stop:27678 length:414 start_codon:yes stop_codon:yes gene_type:complete
MKLVYQNDSISSTIIGIAENQEKAEEMFNNWNDNRAKEYVQYQLNRYHSIKDVFENTYEEYQELMKKPSCDILTKDEYNNIRVGCEEWYTEGACMNMLSEEEQLEEGRRHFEGYGLENYTIRDMPLNKADVFEIYSE